MSLRPGTEVNPLTTLPLPSLPDLLPHTCSHVTAPPDSAHSIFLLCEAAFAGGLMLVHIPFYVTDLFPTETYLFELLCLQPSAYPKECQSLTRSFDLTLRDICYEGREDIWTAVHAHTNTLHAQAGTHNPTGTVALSDTHWNHHAMHMSSQMATRKRLPLRHSVMTKI